MQMSFFFLFVFNIILLFLPFSWPFRQSNDCDKISWSDRKKKPQENPRNYPKFEFSIRFQCIIGENSISSRRNTEVRYLKMWLEIYNVVPVAVAKSSSALTMDPSASSIAGSSSIPVSKLTLPPSSSFSTSRYWFDPYNSCRFSFNLIVTSLLFWFCVLGIEIVFVVFLSNSKANVTKSTKLIDPCLSNFKILVEFDVFLLIVVLLG